MTGVVLKRALVAVCFLAVSNSIRAISILQESTSTSLQQGPDETHFQMLLRPELHGGSTAKSLLA